MASLEETKEILENMPDSNPIFLEGIHNNQGIGKSSIMKPTTIFQKISRSFVYLIHLLIPNKKDIYTLENDLVGLPTLKENENA